MTDDDFLRAFEECRLPKALWTHEAHVRLAWIYLQTKPIEDVIPIVRGGIQRYNASLGNTTGYHETVTLAYLTLINRVARMIPFSELRERHPDLLDRSLSAILNHYSRDRLFSAEAIERFVEPDLAPLTSRNGVSSG